MDLAQQGQFSSDTSSELRLQDGDGESLSPEVTETPPSMECVSLAWLGPGDNPGISWDNCPRLWGTGSGQDNTRVLTQRKQLPATLSLRNSRITQCIPEPRHLTFRGRAKVRQRDVCSCILPAAKPNPCLCHTARHSLQHGRALSQNLGQRSPTGSSGHLCSYRLFSNVVTPVTSWECSLGSLPWEVQGNLTGERSKQEGQNLWTETINCCQMCQLFLLFSQQQFNSGYLL